MSTQKLNSISQEERITWIDSAKGLAIFFIVVGHFLNLGSLEPVNKVIYSFHIPLFFILSGYTYKKSFNIEWNKIFKKAKQLLFPYAVYIILSILFCIVYGNYELTWDKLCYYNASIFFNEPIWFLLVLFAVSAIEHVVCTTNWKISFQVLLLILLSIAGYVCYKYKYGFASCLNHFGFNRIIVCFSFFLLGNLFNKMESCIKLKSEKIEYAIILMSSILWIASSLNNAKCSMYIFYFGNYWLFWLSAVAGSFTIIIVCQKWLDIEPLRRLSRYGIILMGTQYFWLIPLRDFMVSKEINKTIVYDAISFVILCIGIGITVC